jgi:DNA-binding NarL/FixJ family response regulator
MNTISPIYIAIADDHQITVQGVAELINNQVSGRLKVQIIAHDGLDLLDQIAHASHQPDICLVDVGMAPMNGYDTVALLREKYPFIKCIAFTMMHTGYAMLRMYRTGCSAYFLKNQPFPILLDTIMEVYESGISFPACVQRKFPRISTENLQQYIDRYLVTEKYEEFLAQCSGDKTYGEIASAMHLSSRTVENEYAIPLRKKLHIRSRVGLALFSWLSGIGRTNDEENVA